MMITRAIMIIVNIMMMIMMMMMMMMTSSYLLPLKLVDQNEVSDEKFWSRNKLSSSQNRESDGCVSWSKTKYVLCS